MHKHDVKIKLRYELQQGDNSNLADGPISQLRRIFNEPTAFDPWDAVDPKLYLTLFIDGRRLFPYCDLSSLLEMSQKNGNYWPAVCPSCGEPQCDGYFHPVRVYLQEQYIIWVVREPARRSPTQHYYHAYRFSRKNYLAELIGAIVTRICMEDGLKLYSADTDNPLPSEAKKVRERLAALWGGVDSMNWQYDISCKIRKEVQDLILCFQSMRDDH